MFKKRVKWVKLANNSEELSAILGEKKLKRFVIENKSICVLEFENTFYAVADRCPHQGAKLSDGACTAEGYLVCPWHRYGFDIKSGRGPGYFVDTFPIEILSNEIRIGIKKGFLEI